MLHPVILTKARPSGKETRYVAEEAADLACAFANLDSSFCFC